MLLRLLLLAVSATAFAQPRKLLVVSIDGLDTRYLHQTDKLGLKIPTLSKLVREGALAAGVVGVTPTVTWPSHTSIITGVAADEHNIVSNDQPGKPGQRWWFTSFLKARTLWHATAEKKLKSAAIYWPVTVGASVDFNFPEFWKERVGGHEVNFGDMAEKATPGAVEKVAGVYRAFKRAYWDDECGMEATRYALEHERPDLTLVHIADLDAESHEHGAFSPRARLALERADKLLGWTLEKLPAGTVVAIVSDHGFDNNERTVRPKVLLRDGGVKGAVEVREGLIGALDEAAAKFLRSRIGRHGIAREVAMAEVRAMAPKLAHWTAAFDMRSGHFASNDDGGSAVSPGNGKGSHGMWPTRENYRASLVLWGEGVRKTSLGEVSMLELAPTFAEILGVDLPAAKRASLWGRASGR